MSSFFLFLFSFCCLVFLQKKKSKVSPSFFFISSVSPSFSCSDVFCFALISLFLACRFLCFHPSRTVPPFFCIQKAAKAREAELRREQEAAIARIKAEAEARARAEMREKAREEEERRRSDEHEARIKAQVRRGREMESF